MVLNLIKHQRPDFDKIYLFVKDSFKSKYQLLINGREKVGINTPKNLKTFIDQLQATDDVYKQLKDYNATKTRRVLIVSDDLIEGEEKSIFQLFSSHNLIPKCLKINVRQYFIMKIPNKRELQ